MSAAVLYEWRAEIDSGVNLLTGDPWEGHRVRYRQQGTRRWSSFLLSTDDGHTPTETEVLRAIEAHDGR